MYLIIFILLIGYIFTSKKIDTILYLPVLIILSQIVIPWIMAGRTNYNTSQLVQINYLMLMFCIFIFLIYYHLLSRNTIVFILIIFGYFVILLLNSSIFFESFKKYLHIATAFLSLPAYYQYFRRRSENLSSLLKVITLFNFIVIIPVVISSIFRIGTGWGYGQVKYIYLVGINIWALYSVVYSTVLALFLSEVIKSKKYRIYNNVLAFILGILLLLIFKRMTLVTFLIGYLIYLMSVLKVQRKSIVVIFYVMIGGLLILPQFLPIFKSAILSRERVFEIENYSEEGRVTELQNYYEYWFLKKDVISVLLGADFFISGETDNFEAIQIIYGQRRRILHTDIANFLYTTGIIGTMFFLLFLLKYFVLLKRLKNFSYYSKRIYYFVIITVVMNLFSEGVDMVLNYYIVFAITGAIAGYIESENRNNQYKGGKDENTLVKPLI